MGLECLSLPLIVGVIILLSIPPYIPPIQNRARESNLFRLILVLGLGLLAISTTYMILLYSMMQFAITSNTAYFDLSTLIENNEITNAVIQELWVRYILSPVLPNRCLLGDGMACRTANILQNHGYLEWYNYLFLILMSTFTAIATAGIGYFATHNNRKQKQT